MEQVFVSHTKHGSRLTGTAKTTAIFNKAGNYTITCKEEGKDDFYSSNVAVTVHEMEQIKSYRNYF